MQSQMKLYVKISQSKLMPQAFCRYEMKKENTALRITQGFAVCGWQTVHFDARLYNLSCTQTRFLLYADNE